MSCPPGTWTCKAKSDVDGEKLATAALVPDSRLVRWWAKKGMKEAY